MNHFANHNDSELAGKIKSGGKEAYQQLFERYAPRIYQFSISYLHNKMEAEELVQDVFLKIWEKRETLDQSRNIKSFIFKIAVNTIYDRIRRTNLENAFQDFMPESAESDSGSTWNTVIFDDLQANLEILIAQLPGRQQKIFRLSKQEGLTNDEIAQQLNVSKRTVENHLYRAISYLKKHFQNQSFALLFFYLAVNCTL